MIYIPGGGAHEVENLETIMALSMNFVDAVNFDRAVRLLAIDSSERRVVEALVSENFDRRMCGNQVRSIKKVLVHVGSNLLGSFTVARVQEVPSWELRYNRRRLYNSSRTRHCEPVKIA